MKPAAFSAFRVCLFATLLSSCAWGQATCAHCPVPEVDAKASTPFAKADTSKGCKTRTRIGFPVPDPQCTPGAINPTVTVEVLRNKAFRTDCLRDCASTEGAKGATYGFYSIPHPVNNRGLAQTCELDHLVSLELGGADTIDNIWPQCGPNQVELAKRYFKQKDVVENYLAVRVRTGKLILADVQKGIAADWTQYLGAATTFCKNNPITCGLK